MSKEQLLVEISPQVKYPIFIDFDPINTLEEKIYAHTDAGKILIVISEKVNKIYGKDLNFKNSIKFVLKDGESQKNFKNYQKILNFALKNRLERKDAIVAIGGGVVGDITGFVAATYLRGIDFIQIPTTLLACVDSSLGGKVAINTDFGKNLVGAFYQPKAVFCNLNFLKTLDERQFKTGLAEVIKYAFIQKNCPCANQESFFDFLEHNADDILLRSEEALLRIVKVSLELKAGVVVNDEKEEGLRKILNFGHTYAHAVEKITDYKKYTHGEAVAMGMDFAISLAFTRGLINEEYKNQGMDLIKRYSLVKNSPKFPVKELVEAMKSDKKIKDGKVSFILPVQKSTVETISINPEEIF